MIPLIRQDEFVVKEAESLVLGRVYSSLLNPQATSSALPSLVEQKYTKVNSSNRVAKGERKG